MTNQRRLPSGRIIDLDSIVELVPGKRRGEPEMRAVLKGVAPDEATPFYDDADTTALLAWAAAVPALCVVAPPEGANAPFKVGDRVSFRYSGDDDDIRVGVVRAIDPEDESLFVCVPGKRGPSGAEGVRGTGWWMMKWEFYRVTKVSP